MCCRSPTGGIDERSAAKYLALTNVPTVGDGR
jgi:2-keto-3-deoxy-6-phosphogluconate aldolase